MNPDKLHRYLLYLLMTYLAFIVGVGAVWYLESPPVATHRFLQENVNNCAPLSLEEAEGKFVLDAGLFTESGKGTKENPYEINEQQISRVMRFLAPSEPIIVDGRCSFYRIDNLISVPSNTTVTRFRFDLSDASFDREPMLSADYATDVVIKNNVFDFTRK